MESRTRDHRAHTVLNHVDQADILRTSRSTVATIHPTMLSHWALGVVSRHTARKTLIVSFSAVISWRTSARAIESTRAPHLS
jgi:hypothetical protein